MVTNIETTDIFRGAFIICMGGTLESIRFGQTRTNIAYFLFTGGDLLKHDRDYINGRALVNPLQFREALNSLRDILFKRLRDNKLRETRYDRKRDNQSHQRRV